MSSIKTTQIDGDVSVGRNVAVGGSATIQGNSQFKGNVKVDGWLDAKNVKGANKGIFTSIEKLKAAFPFPHDGWWAIVGTSLPGPIYVGDGGEWVPTGETGGNPTVDSEQYNQSVAQLQTDISALQTDIREIEAKDKAQDGNITILTNSVNSVTEQVGAIHDIATAAKEVTDSKGAAGGIAPLDSQRKIPADYLPSYVDDVIEFSETVENITAQLIGINKTSTDEGCSVVYDKISNRFVLRVIEKTQSGDTVMVDNTYYNNWLDGDNFGETNDAYGRTPLAGKVYVDKLKNITYRWSGSALVPIGSDLALGYTSGSAFPGSEGKQLQEDMDVAERDIENLYTQNRSLNSYAIEVMRQTTVRSVVNINQLFGLGETEITLSVALDRVSNYEKAELIQIPGVVLTFLTESGWKSKQWTNTDDWLNESNWTDFGANGESIGNTINVNALCENIEYSLGTAIQAVLNLEEESGLSYFKSGVVLTFKTSGKDTNGAPIWLAYQFTREVSDINPADEKPWIPFGAGSGGESEVATSDTPEEGGKDAFSTGGAYNSLPADISVDSESEVGVVKVKLVNASGDVIGDEKQFAIGTGTGGQTGLILEITPKQSPLYGQAGGTMLFEAAITLKGATAFESGIIERVELSDRDTGQLLETFKLNKATSADKESFDFVFDLSAYFTQAQQRRLRFTAYDDSDRSASRNVNVTAVDVTITSAQTLEYSASTALAVGGAPKTLLMYKFANNASDKGILCTTEIYLDGEWKTLGTATVSDTYSHNVTIDPKNCLGTVLQHGAYHLRIHGEDVSSGVVGNYLHTAVMVIEPGNTTPIVVSRWYTEKAVGEIKQYETISMDFAAYVSNANYVNVQIVEKVGTDETVRQTTQALRNKTYTYIQRVQGRKTDGTENITLYAKTGTVKSEDTVYTVNGSLLDIEPVTTQLMVDIDFSTRNNADTDKSITYGNYTMTVEGANYTTNGFIKDSYGTENYGQAGDTGIMALRIAENVKASLDYAPFNVAAIETNGMAVQFRIRAKHVEDDTTRLISCISGGFGFFATGKNVVFTTDNCATTAHTITSALKDDSVTDVAIVIKPASQAPYAGIGVVEMYFDGELIGTCYYNRGSLLHHNTPITFDGTHGDLYLYNIRAWETWYSFEQSFDNYLLKLSDTDAMITEYRYNQVMASQSAEGKPATNRPQAAALYEIGIPYFVVCKNATTADTPDNYPDYLETLDGDKKTTRILDIYAYFPERPWQDFKATGVTVSNQGTTSSMRPIKNIKMKFKAAEITLLHSRDEFGGDEQLKYDECAANAANHRVQPLDSSLPTNIITVKVDYSESGGANNGGSVTLFNQLQRAMGAAYITPAQAAYTGKYTLNTSIDSVPCAFFRTDPNSPDATSPSYGYFHAKGNWGHDKGDAKVFGFENADGYNKGCLNYGDFIEVIANRDEMLAEFDARVDKSAWNTEEIYVLSEFCGPYHRVYRYQDGAWTETTGRMEYAGGRWRITGDVVNPVENYEILVYNSLAWFQNVNSIDDMLTPDDKGIPVWMSYFESRYPDDDNLNQAYEDGRKVPYWLFKWLEWCQQCNQNLTADDGSITLDGATVEGTPANRLLKFKRELHKVANVHSMICYHVFTDYIAAVDQRSKNMMIGFYLEQDGSMRMYLNHLYDGDTVLGSDNDCGLTIPALLDPNNDPKGYYQGHDSVLFTQLAHADYLWLTDYESDADTSDTTKTTTVAAVAKAMREVQLQDGLRPFSPQGIEKYWITDRLQKWPKLVSSYDGIRKYIEHSKSSSNYFYALHGLSIQRLQDFVKTRFLYRDGFYQCGDTFSSAVEMRCTGTDMSVDIVAAKDGFFGLGVDQANSARESVYLKAGERVTLHSGNTNLAGGVMLYVFGADSIAELDIRNATPKGAGWDISKMILLKRLIIGGEGYTPETENPDDILATLNLGQMPFLEEIDVRNFPIRTIDASYCPRLKKVLAEGSKLQSVILAETSPVNEVTLPDTITELALNNLPNLTYPGGLTIAGMSHVGKVFVNECPHVDTMTLLEQITTASELKTVRIPNVNATASVNMLRAIMNSGAIGLDEDGNAYDESGQCSGITGRWILSELISNDDTSDGAGLTTLSRYFPELEVINSQFSIVRIDDVVENDTCEKYSNPENETGYAYNKPFVPSGHTLAIRKSCHAFKCSFNSRLNQLEGVQISDDDFNYLANGSSFDNSDSAGEGFDILWHAGHHWYKGVNDYKNQRKFILYSTTEAEPLSTAKRSKKFMLSEILHAENAGVYVDEAVAGNPLNEEVIAVTSNTNVYKMDVEGMKQVRFPGMNHARLGGVFTDGNGKIVGTFNMSVTHTYFDFSVGNYLFCDVPTGSKFFYFTSYRDIGDIECLTVDSSSLEAIEPEWTEHTVGDNDSLVGVYPITIDGLKLPRSLSGAIRSKKGNGTSTTSNEWQMDGNGDPTQMPNGTINYTAKDFQNSARMRGPGYQLQDYEQHKEISNLWWALNGTTNEQSVVGNGAHDAVLNSQDTIGMADTPYVGNAMNSILGLKHYVGCDSEWLDYIAFNVSSYAAFYKSKCTDADSSYPTDYVAHIYDPVTKTERTVQSVTSGANCVVRVVHGAKCDILPSKVHQSDTSMYITHYAAGFWLPGSRGRCVLRSGSYSNALSGLAYASANYASSYSYTYYGARLAFRGKFVIIE